MFKQRSAVCTSRAPLLDFVPYYEYNAYGEEDFNNDGTIDALVYFIRLLFLSAGLYLPKQLMTRASGVYS